MPPRTPAPTKRAGQRRDVSLQIRISASDRDRIRRRAAAVGVSASEYIRRRALAGLDVEPAPTIEKAKAEHPPIPGQTTVEEIGAAAEVQAEVQEAKLEDEGAREAFVKRRALQLYGQGRTKRLARVEAEAEWRKRGTA